MTNLLIPSGVCFLIRLEAEDKLRDKLLSIPINHANMSTGSEVGTYGHKKYF